MTDGKPTPCTVEREHQYERAWKRTERSTPHAVHGCLQRAHFDPASDPTVSHLMNPERLRVGTRHLALSTNSIEKIAGLAGMDALQILSLGRNLIRKIEGLDPVAETLEQLWLSYNQLERLVCAARAQSHKNESRS